LKGAAGTLVLAAATTTPGMGKQPGLFEKANRRLANELQYLHIADDAM